MPEKTSGEKITPMSEPTSVTLDEKTKVFPSSFTLQDRSLSIDHVISTQTEATKRTVKGTIKANLYRVRTSEGTFQLRHNLSEDTWSLIGKLEE